MNKILKDCYDQLLPLLNNPPQKMPPIPPLPGQLKPGEKAPDHPTLDELLEWTTSDDYPNSIPPWRE